MELFDNKMEKASLGSALLNKEALYNSMETLSVEDFYYYKNKKIFKVIKELFKNNINIDELIITREADKNKLPNDPSEGYKNYVYELIASVPCMGKNYEYYNGVVKKKSEQRKVWIILEEIKKGNVTFTREEYLNAKRKENMLNKITQQLSKLRNAKEAIQNNSNLDVKQKQNRINNIDKLMNNLVRKYYGEEPLD
jgi:replicative DNA helicase